MLNSEKIKRHIKRDVVESRLFHRWVESLLVQNDTADTLLERDAFSNSTLDTLHEIYRPSVRRRAKAIYRYEPSLALSIILPVYNVENYLDACLVQLLSVGCMKNYEVIAVNDGSTDSSRSVLERFRRGHSALRIVDQENRGLSAARNTGLAESRGRYVTFVDSDDVVDCGELLSAISLLEGSAADYVSGNYQRIDDRGVTFGPVSSVTDLMVPWGRVFRREVWQDIRFPEGYWYEDLIMPYLVESRFTGLKTDSITYFYRDRPGSIVNSTAGNPKGLDSFYLIRYMLDECERLHIPFERVLETTLAAMGPTLLSRTTVLNPEQMVQLFRACCDLVLHIDEFTNPHGDFDWWWEALHTSLLTRNYRAWCASCLAISLGQEIGGARRAIELLFAERKKR